MSAIYDANEYLIAGLENQTEWWEHLGDAHRDYAALAREALSLQQRAEAAENEVARLKDGLRRLEELAQAWVKVDTYDGLDMEPRRTAHARAQIVLEQARALLAEDGAA